jgi:hypothetical protein
LLTARRGVAGGHDGHARESGNCLIPEHRDLQSYRARGCSKSGRSVSSDRQFYKQRSVVECSF